jgi:predicted RNA-binding Zn ribbon-like protein
MSRDWRGEFLFVGNNLALDFLNTRPVVDGAPVELLSDDGAAARWLAAARLVDERETARLERRWARAPHSKTIEALREFRERLRKAVCQIEGGEAPSEGFIREINRLLARHPYPDQIVSEGSGLARRKRFSPQRPEDLYGPLAAAVADLLTDADRTRIRKCTSCVLHFLDTSKKGTRQWCSMNLCGNRSKVAAYALRQRIRAEDEG